MARPSPAAAPLTAQIIDLEDREGPRAAYAALQSRLRAIRAEGTDVPPNLKQLEQRLLTECYSMSQGR